MAVRVDGEREHEVLLREGEMARWGALRGFVVTVGNPGGVELILDGQPVPLRHQQGGVVRDLHLPGPPQESSAGPVPPEAIHRKEASPPGKPPSPVSSRTQRKAIAPPGPP